MQNKIMRVDFDKIFSKSSRSFEHFHKRRLVIGYHNLIMNMNHSS